MTICEYVKSWLRDIFACIWQWFMSLKPRDLTYACTAQFYKAKVNPRSRRARYDTDSKVIRIDNCASYSISFDKSDFVSPLVPVKHRIKGLGGTLNQVQKGTISCNRPQGFYPLNIGLKRALKTNHGAKRITMKLFEETLRKAQGRLCRRLSELNGSARNGRLHDHQSRL